MFICVEQKDSCLAADKRLLILLSSKRLNARYEKKYNSLAVAVGIKFSYDVQEQKIWKASDPFQVNFR